MPFRRLLEWGVLQDRATPNRPAVILFLGLIALVLAQWPTKKKKPERSMGVAGRTYLPSRKRQWFR